jgi:DNA segregation ATPase FtsK/SpoIIIE, S-DNA-T family
MTKTRQDPGEQTTLGIRLKQEIFGLLLALLAIVFTLSLVSYNPADPSFNNTAEILNVSNLMGKMGSYLSDIFLQLLGLGSYLFSLLLILFSLMFFLRRSVKHKFLRSVGFLLTLLSMTILVQVGAGQIEFYGSPIASGGLMGRFLGDFSIEYFNRIGACLIFSTFSIIGIILATDFSVVSVALLIGKIFKALLEKINARRDVSAQRKKRRAEAKIEEKLEERKKRKPPVIVNPEAIKPKKEKKVKPEIRQTEFAFAADPDKYLPPGLDLLDYQESDDTLVDPKTIEANAQILENKLADFGVEGHVVNAYPGPVITMYEFQPAPGIKVSQIANLSNDLAMAMSAESIRILAPIPGKSVVGIEIPNHNRQTVYLKEIIGSEKFKSGSGKIPLALGKDISGQPVVANLVKMPHLLIAGATGMGKSVGLNCIITSILYGFSPSDLRLLLFDPKMVELSPYNGIPHLLSDAITDARKAPIALQWAVDEMERRYTLLKLAGVRKVEEFNSFVRKLEKKSKDGTARIPNPIAGMPGKEDEDDELEIEKLPYIVIIIDELADLMVVAGKEVEELIYRLAQKARAAGMHLIVATQRPDVKVLTGTIKANLPSRIAFRVSSSTDSRVILDNSDAKFLLRNGDMLFIPPDISGLMRVHGALVTNDELKRVIKHLTKMGKTEYDPFILTPRVSDLGGGLDNGMIEDEKYDSAVFIVTSERKASISYLQRRLNIGYNRAAKLIERMQQEGVVSAPQGAKNEREILAPPPPAN